MTNKTVLVKALTGKGFNAEISDGVVMIMLEREKFKDKDVNSEIARIVRDIGYKGSLGLRMVRNESKD